MPANLILDPTQIDCNHVIADIEAIRKVNPQRFHMENLHAIVMVDYEKHLIAGYRDIRDDEFWVAGHMPGYPLFPGVMMLEAAAQLAAYYTKTVGILRDQLLGLGGVDNARFRSPVQPGDRLLLIGKGLRVDRRQTKFYVTGHVGSVMAFHVEIIGVPIPGREKVLMHTETSTAN